MKNIISILALLAVLTACKEEDPGLPELSDQRSHEEQELACQHWLDKTAKQNGQVKWSLDSNLYAKKFALYKAKDSNSFAYELLEIYLDNDTLRYAKGNQDMVKYNCPKVQWLKPNYQKFSLLSSTYYEFFNQLQSLTLIKSISFGDQVNQPVIQSLVKSGVIQDLGKYESLNAEKMVQFLPDIVVNFQGVGNEPKALKKMRDLKVPVITTFAWKENHPLGRAEWIKVFAWLIQRESLAAQKFEELVQNYNKIKIQAKTYETSPQVIAAAPYDGSWFVPALDSYMGNLIQDAGGDYLFKYKGSGSVKIQTEQAIKEVLDADVWVNVNNWKLLSQIPSPYNNIKAVKSSQVYHNHKRQIKSGNDFYESGVYRADLVLRDLVRLLHSPEEKLIYYDKLK